MQSTVRRHCLGPTQPIASRLGRGNFPMAIAVSSRLYAPGQQAARWCHTKRRHMATQDGMPDYDQSDRSENNDQSDQRLSAKDQGRLAAERLDEVRQYFKDRQAQREVVTVTTTP